MILFHSHKFFFLAFSILPLLSCQGGKQSASVPLEKTSEPSTSRSEAGFFGALPEVFAYTIPEGTDLMQVSIRKREAAKYPLVRIEIRMKVDNSGVWKESTPEYMVADHLMVTLKESKTRADLKTALENTAYKIRNEVKENVFLVSFNEKREGAYEIAMEQLSAKTDLVKRVEKDALGMGGAVTPNDPYWPLWGMERIRMPEAWELTTCSQDVVVVILDTGIDRDHPDLLGQSWVNLAEQNGIVGVDDDANGYIDDVYGWDFVNNDNDPMGDHSHGTHIAGTVNGLGNNSVGIAGVCWGAKVMAVKALDQNNSFVFSDLIPALGYITSFAPGIKILNASIGSNSTTTSYAAAWDSLDSAGVLALVAAMNDGRDIEITPRYPASYVNPRMIVVANIKSSGDLNFDSNWGLEDVDLAAPGTSIMSSIVGGGYGSWSGTSMATPHVAGVAAMLSSRFPTWNALQIRDAILGNVADNAFLVGKTVTGGELDAYAALAANLPSSSSALSSSLFSSSGISSSSAGLSSLFSSSQTVGLVDQPPSGELLAGDEAWVYTVPKSGEVLLDVIDASGRLIHSERVSAVAGENVWDAPSYPAGNYFLRVRQRSFQQSRKVFVGDASVHRHSGSAQ